MKTIGNYFYENNFIGKGTFSKVYIGYNKDNPNEKVAIKKIYKKDDAKYKKYIEKEIEIMYKLNHKNIIKLYETIYTEQYIFLILELCNTDLYKFIQNNELNEENIQYIIKQIVEAIKYIMDNNIVHRDLKPHNILINKNLDIKLADFGFAREFKDTLLSDTICGSPLYMAPEILNNQKYNIKSDIWSLGIIMYEMVMKNHPFKTNNMKDLIEKINNKKPIIVNVNVSENCKNLIYKLLEIDYKKRLDWEDIFTNEWIYNDLETMIENKITEDTYIKKEDSFDYMFDSVNNEISHTTNHEINNEINNTTNQEINNTINQEINNVINDELTFKKENYVQTKIDDKLNITKAMPINIKKNTVNEYVIVNKPLNNSLSSIMNDSMEYLKYLFKN